MPSPTPTNGDARQIAFVFGGVRIEQMTRDHQAEDPVAEPFQTLVVGARARVDTG